MNKLIEFISPGADFPAKKAVIALGVFDGVHPGHRKVVTAAARLAGELGAAAGAVTFIPHPRQILGGSGDLKLLMPEKMRIAELRDSGADFVAKINFSREIADWDAERFLIELRDCGLFQLAGICVGSNWRFGKKGCGDRKLLAGFCRNNGIEFIPVEEVEIGGKMVSSTLIRALIAEGKLDEVFRVYGRYPLISGVVRSGMGAAGRELQAPTANLELQYGIMVPDGVYAGKAEVDGVCYAAVLNVGKAPTYNVDETRIEVHLIGFSGNLYGRDLSVSLIRKLRDIIKFDSAEQLKAQIAQDISCTLQV